MGKNEEEINQEWKTFVIDNNIGDDLKSFCKGQAEKGRFNGLDILNLIENISIRFAKSISNLKDMEEN